ncbi:MAPEG family protein [Luteimonas notoginsengisoli]|jgi:uncharacterized MAPEG superfamily protein|uniref:MAPEG family protein n=1 Tax=Luteimonas notoginsengisoli TaxID=1578200 RepID=A0ABV7UVY2_9GAMM
MSIAYWCILAAALLPYVWAFLAKRGPRYDNHDPRGWLAKRDDPRAHRANAAHLNAFEAFAPFAAAVLMAQAAGVDPALVATLSLIFVALRVLHGIFYVTDLHLMRSVTWMAGFACVLWMMVAAALQVGG